MFRFKLTQRKTGIADFQAVTKYAERTPGARLDIGCVAVGFFKLRDQRVEEMALGVVGVNAGEFLPLLRLGGLYEV
ncbi:Uncharacterised protein [Escherichia coli]|nr:Uncharacterised protein [Escherichia coli]